MTAIPLRYLALSALLHAGLVVAWQWSPSTTPTATPLVLSLVEGDAAETTTPQQTDTTLPPAARVAHTDQLAPPAARTPAPADGARSDITHADIAVGHATPSTAAGVATSMVTPVADTDTQMPATAHDGRVPAETAAGIAADNKRVAEIDTAIETDTVRLAHQLQARLRGALAVHKVYPALAYRNGWQGDVKVGLRISADGRLRDIHLVASSGYGVLDRAALASLGKVERLDGAGWLGERYFDMVLPIHYRLIDG